jgi:uncharacterized protein
MLSAAARQQIEAELAALERQTGDQVAVLIVKSLDGEALEEYSVKVAHTWKLGQKGKDDGVLLFLSRDDRKIRIEVGYGLEGTLTDLQSHEIVDGQIRPRFQSGDFDGGIEQGVAAIAQVLAGHPLPPPAASAPAAARMPIGQRIVFGILFCVVIGIFSCLALILRGVQSWFLYAFLTPFYLAFPLVAAGPAAAAASTGLWLIAFPVVKYLRRNAPPAKPGRSGFWARMASTDGSWTSGAGGWSSADSGASSSSGSDSFSSGGSDSFSGGGGDFGGGGSSGSW